MVLAGPDEDRTLGPGNKPICIHRRPCFRAKATLQQKNSVEPSLFTNEQMDVRAASGVYLSWENLVSYQLGSKGMALLGHRVIIEMRNLVSCFSTPWSSVSSL